MYPGLTADELLAPQPLPFAEPGLWNYHRLSPDGVPGGFVALPGSELVLDRPNTVAVVCSSTALGVEFQDQEDHECLALIDRSDEAVRCGSNPRPAPGLGLGLGLRVNTNPYSGGIAGYGRVTGGYWWLGLWAATTAPRWNRVCGYRGYGRYRKKGRGDFAALDRVKPSVPSLVQVTNPAALDPRLFYALADESGVVQIRWVEALPAGWRVLGRLIFTQVRL